MNTLSITQFNTIKSKLQEYGGGYAVNIMDYDAGYDEPLFVKANTQAEALKIARQYIKAWSLNARIEWILSLTALYKAPTAKYYGITGNNSLVVLENGIEF